MPGLLTISDPELQNIVELFMKVVFKQLIKTNATVIYLEGVALVIEIFYWYVSTSLCTVTVGLAQLAGPSLRTRKEQILVWNIRETKESPGSSFVVVKLSVMGWFEQHVYLLPPQMICQNEGFLVCAVHFPKCCSSFI